MRVLHDLAAIERRAQRGGVRVLAAQAAADAAVEHRGDGIHAQWIRRRLHRQRRAAGQADARMVAGARVLVDAVLDAHRALARREPCGTPRLDAALALELALAFGDDDLEP